MSLYEKGKPHKPDKPDRSKHRANMAKFSKAMADLTQGVTALAALAREIDPTNQEDYAILIAMGLAMLELHDVARDTATLCVEHLNKTEAPK